MSWNIDLPTTDYFELDLLSRDQRLWDRFVETINEVKAVTHLAIDTETTGLVIWKDIPLYWSLAWGHRRITLHANVLHYFKESFDDPRKSWIMANAKYDTHILANVGIVLQGRLVDTCVQHSLLYEDSPHGLKYMAKHLLGWTYGDFQDQFGKITALQSPEQLMRKAEKENMNLLIEYAANDAWATWKVYLELQEQMKRAITHSLFRETSPYIETIWDLFDKVEVPYTKVLWRMERRGIRVDREHLERSEPVALKEIHGVEKELAQVLGYVINPNSPKQLREYFFEKRGFAPLKKSKGGKTGVRTPSTDSDFLEHIKYDDPVAPLVLKHRELTKLHGTYIKGLHKLLDPRDRVHTRFNQDVARCMPAGELVLTDRGYLPVETVVEGDYVLSHRGKARQVRGTSVHAPSTIYKVTLANGLSLRTTADHKYRREEGWTAASELTLNLEVMTHSGPERWSRLRTDTRYAVSSWGRVRLLGALLELVQVDRSRPVRLLGVYAHIKGVNSEKGWVGVNSLVSRAYLMQDVPKGPANGITWDNSLRNLFTTEPPYSIFTPSKVIAISLESPQITYGLEVEEDHSHVTGGIVTHNTGRLSSAEPNCFDGDTEVLTREGWVALSKLEKGVQIAQWDTDGTLSWAVPTAYHRYRFVGDMIKITGRVEARVTPDHRMVIKTQGGYWRTQKAEKLTKGALPTAGLLDGPVSLRKEQVQLIAAIQADASLYPRKTKPPCVSCGFTKARKIARLESILNTAGVTYKKHKESLKGVQRFSFTMPDFVRPFINDKKEFELAPFLEISLTNRRHFLQELEFWDGNRHSKGHLIQYWTSDRKSAEVVLTIASISGTKAYIGDYAPSKSSYPTKRRRYSVTLMEGNPEYHIDPKRHVTRVEHDDDVWCITVPSDKVITRYNSKICIMHQCQNIPKPENDKWNLRGSFIPEEGNTMVVFDYKQLEMRLLAAASMDPDMIGVFAREWDIHMGNAALMFGLPYEDIAEAKAIEASVKDGELPEASLTPYVKQCLVSRSDAKNVGFGLNYGMGASALAKRLNCTVEQAKGKIGQYNKTYPAVESFFKEAVEETRRTGYSFTILGRRRNVPEINSHRKGDIARGERIATNTEIQGCLPASAKILTPNGYVPITSQQAGTVWTGSGWASYRLLSMGRARRAEISLSNGKTLNCDVRHQLLTSNGKDYVFKHFNDIEIGDEVCLNLARPIECGTRQAHPDHFYWMGFGCGNAHSSSGKHHRNAITFTFGDRKRRYNKEDKSNEFVKYVNKSLGVKTQKPQVHENKISITVENKSVRKLFESLGYCWGANAPDKLVPSSVWTADLECRNRFLLGMLDADGYLHDVTPNLHLCQREILDEIQLLLRISGIESTVRGPYVAAWRLDIVGSQLAKHLSYGSLRSTKLAMPAPTVVVDRVIALGAGTTESHKVLRARALKTGRLNVYTAVDMLNASGVPVGQVYATRKVTGKKVSQQQQEMYTLAVNSKGHRFDAEGIIHKNSAADVCKMAQIRIDNHGITKLYDAHMILQVHDELVFECPTEAADEVMHDVRELMEHPFTQDLAVALTVDGGKGSSWGEAK